MPQTRISPQAHRTLRRLAEESGATSEQLLDRALEGYERRLLLEAINAGYAALKSDPEGSAANHDEREVWDVTPSEVPEAALRGRADLARLRGEVSEDEIAKTSPP